MAGGRVGFFVWVTRIAVKIDAKRVVVVVFKIGLALFELFNNLGVFKFDIDVD